MVLFFKDGKAFATGAARYQYIPATEGESTNRIFLKVEIAGYPIEAIVDTGAPYVILAPGVARAIGFDPAYVLGRETMLIRGMRLDGSIIRFNMKLLADVGQHLELQGHTRATPEPHPSHTRATPEPHPSHTRDY
ncbi:MAG: hypothetical protein EBE86_029435 [Hormoscilla sp. GUM202]|nr:hypothetical protein [Hormoscilla sp. GUM202]